MSKRVADQQLTDLNWEDKEAEADEEGEFKKASDDVLRNRVIRTAKRRVAPGTTSDTSSAFSGFAGFGAPSSTNGATKPSFSFGAKSDAPKSSFSFSATKTEPPKPEITSVSSTTDINTNNDNKNTNPKTEIKDEVFLKKLKKLNESVLKFSQDHINKNPLVILTSVFDDYARHLKRIQSESKPVIESTEPTSTKEVSPSFKFNATKEAKPTPKESPKESEPKPFSFGTQSKPLGIGVTTSLPDKPLFGYSSSESKPALSFGTAGAKPSFSFAPADSSTKPAFSFKPAESGTAPSFTFAAKPFTGFGTLGAGPTVEKKAVEEEEEETPPVVEKMDHIEKDNLYHVKCKLFLKSGTGWNEKGVGIANLKECGEKVQLLIRNDTTMGTVVLNTLLNDKIPITHMGKNSLMIVVAKQAEKDETASTETYLIRVKNKDIADQFYEELQKYKSGLPAKEGKE